MRTNKKKDNMASWRKDLPDLPEGLREKKSDGNKSSSDVSRAFSKRYSLASLDSYSPDNDKETLSVSVNLCKVFRQIFQDRENLQT